MSYWPHIRTLELMDQQVIPTVIFRGLFAALRRCPHLHTRDILLGAVNIDIYHTAESFLHTSLKHLNLTSSDMLDVEACIIFSMSIEFSCQLTMDTNAPLVSALRSRGIWNMLGYLGVLVVISPSDRCIMHVGCLGMKPQHFTTHAMSRMVSLQQRSQLSHV
ncbi:hypothetical protein F4604DRAFT_1767167 [Suillus subluteus]|nr:hypothetical protein F4604DRAFT_1767167 [Suillus subluteus]